MSESTIMGGEEQANGASSVASKLHIFFFPFVTPGHMIPMINMAKLFARRGVKATLLTIPHHEPLLSRSIDRTRKLGFDIDVLTMRLPLERAGLPDHCQSLPPTTSVDARRKFLMAIKMLDEQLEKLIAEHRPVCVISDIFLPWTVDVARKCGIPRLAFHGTSLFSICATQCVRLYRPHDNVSSDSDPFLIPSFPGEITMTRAIIPNFMKEEMEFTKFYIETKESELKSYGVVVNSFYELEDAYAKHYRNVLGGRSWSVGPVSLCNEEIEDMLERGNRPATDCLKWLDSKDTDSVVYICFGSMAKFSSPQLREISSGLEASGQPFIWVVKKDDGIEEGKEEWLPQGYEERLHGTGLIIRGWAPQVPILEHRAVGGFVTHCGWNSTLEGIAAGVAMVTWPLSAEQFYNEKLITEVLRIGVPVGAKQWMWQEVEESVESEQLEKAVRRVMVGGSEADEMRARVKELSEMAKEAVKEGGSSHTDLMALLEELKSTRL